MRTIGHWVDGRAVTPEGSRTSPVWNPATGVQQAEVLLAGADEVGGAVGSAAEAFGEWSQASLSRRSKVLFGFRELVNAHADRLAEMITDEHGKVLADARGEVQRGLEVVEFACGIPQLLKGEYSDQVSTGVDVVLVPGAAGRGAGITPFNFPVMVPMWMYPVAIACGNTFVLKPSERDPSASLFVAELWQRGRPAGRGVQGAERRQGGGRRAAGRPAGGGGLVRRVDPDRPLHPPRGREREAGAGPGWGEEPRGGAAGRRRRLRRRAPGRGRVRVGRGALHGRSPPR